MINANVLRGGRGSTTCRVLEKGRGVERRGGSGLLGVALHLHFGLQRGMWSVGMQPPHLVAI